MGVEHLAYGDEHHVAHLVTEPVVHPLEPIQVGDEQRNGPDRLTRDRLEIAGEAPAVQERRQIVKVRLLGHHVVLSAQSLRLDTAEHRAVRGRPVRPAQRELAPRVPHGSRRMARVLSLDTFELGGNAEREIVRVTGLVAVDRSERVLDGMVRCLEPTLSLVGHGNRELQPPFGRRTRVARGIERLELGARIVGDVLARQCADQSAQRTQLDLP